MLRIYVCALFFTAVLLRAAAGEAVTIPPSEMQALDRAINRELNASHLGSQTLGDLRRLKQRLLRMQTAAQQSQTPAPAEREAALQPLGGNDGRPLLERLEAEAAAGGRPARRSLALFHLYQNEPEKALTEWRRMGRASDSDLPFLILSAYMELALGEYNAGRSSLETALRHMDSRSSLLLSPPVFCSNIGGYRIYTPRSGGDLLPGEDVLLYVEVEGAEFTSAPEGGSECRLMFGLTLRNETGSIVWSEKNYGEYAPIFAGRIRDLHAALTWRVPNDLQPGRYRLTAEAVEEKTKRFGESHADFAVGRRPTSPESRPTSSGIGIGMAQEEIERRIRDAGQPFMGGSRSGSRTNAGALDADFARRQMFEIAKEYEKSQRAEK